MIPGCLLAVLLATQTPLTETIEVRIHNVDVIVTDKSGKPVHGLRQDDFELLEDGKAQKITNFAEYAEAEAIEPGRTESAPLHQTPPPRKLVIFVDDMSMHANNRWRLAKNAAELIDNTMRPGDEAVVIRPVPPGQKVAFDFSGDRDVVHAALKKAVDANTYRPDVAFEGEVRRFVMDLKHAAGNRRAIQEVKRRYAARVKRRVDNRLAALRAVLATLAPLPGRKVLIMITESLPAMPGREFFDSQEEQALEIPATFDAPSDFLSGDYVDMTPVIEEIARIASSNGITIYGLQPEYDLRLQAGGDVTSRRSSGFGATNAMRVQRAMQNTAETMNVLTEKTGGTWRVGGTRTDDILEMVARDIQSYYSLAYRASDDFDRAHRVEVRVRNRPDLRVRARNEVVRKSLPREMTDRVVAALVTENVPNDLGIAARAAAPVRQGVGKYNVAVDVGVYVGNLTLLRDGDKYRGRFTVHYAVSGKESDFLSGVEPEQIVEIPVVQWETAKSKIWRHTLHMRMSKGQHHVAVGILDGVSQRAGMTTLNVDVR